MAFHMSLSDLDDEVVNEADRVDTTDTCACPSTVELSKAVSVSLGLDSVCSPPNNTNSGGSSSVGTDYDPSAGNSSRADSRLPGNMNPNGVRVLHSDTNPREDEFGEVCHGMQQVSCMDLLRSNDMDSAHSFTRGPVITRYMCRDSNFFINPVPELPTAPHQPDGMLPLKQYSTTNPSLYRETMNGVWCANERVYGEGTEPDRAAAVGHNGVCKYCNSVRGSRQECRCMWYEGNQDEQQVGKGVIRAEYGQVESYQSAVPQGHATYSSIKTEPAIWVDCTDRGFR